MRSIEIGCRVKAVSPGLWNRIWILMSVDIRAKFHFMNKRLLWAYNTSAKQAVILYFLTSENRKGKEKECDFKDVIVPAESVLLLRSNFVRLSNIPGVLKTCKLNCIVVRLNLFCVQWHIKMSNNFNSSWIRSTEYEKGELYYVMSHIKLERYCVLCLPSGWRLVLLVILVKVLSHLWRRALHENPLLYKPSTSLWRRYLPWTAHWRSTLQYTAMSRYGKSTHAALLFSATE